MMRLHRDVDAVRVFNPNHAVDATARITDIARLSGARSATLAADPRQRDVAERGTLRWVVRDPSGRPLVKGTIGVVSVGVGKTRSGTARIALGTADRMRAGTWTITVYFVTADHAFESLPVPFRQPF
jgi:hypothetical protein